MNRIFHSNNDMNRLCHSIILWIDWNNRITRQVDSSNRIKQQMYNFPGTNPGLVSISFELTTQWLITTTQSRISLSRVRLKYVTISTVLSTFHALLNEMEMKDSDTKLKKTASSLQSNLSICISYTSIITRFA